MSESANLLRLAFVFLACGTVMAAQTSQPVFRSGADLVRFDLSVVDETGRAITDLTAGEFEIIEAGSKRPVLLFQHIEEPAGTYVEAAVRAVSAEVSSNQGTPRGHLYLFIFDQQHISPGNEQPARRAAEAFIRRRVRPSDRVAIFGLPGPGPLLGFTADRVRAAAELQKVRGDLQRNMSTPMGTMSVQDAYEIARGNDQVIADLLSRAGSNSTGDLGAPATLAGIATGGRNRGPSEDPGVVRRLIQENARTVVAQTDAESRQFLQRLADVIRQYSAIEGRKTVVLFSEGFHQRNVSRDVERVAAAASQSHCIFYAMDMNRRASGLEQLDAPGADAGIELQDRLEPLGTLVAETDGVLVKAAANRLDDVLERLGAESQAYYLVGFEPSAAALADRSAYRRVTVKVRRPGARVRARSGYALDPAPATPADRRRSIDAALAAPFPQQALRIAYTTYVMRSESTGGPRVILSVAADLPVRDGRGDQADVVFVVRDTRDGRVVASATETMPLPDRAIDGSSTGTGSHRVQFDVPPGVYLMRTVVREPGGLMGSADRRLDVRPLNGPGIGVSDLVIGSATGTLAVRPIAHVEDGVSGLIETYGRTAEQLDDSLNVIVDLLPAAGGPPAVSVQAELQPLERSEHGAVRRASFDLPLATIIPGEYVARATVKAHGETAAQVLRQIDVAAGTAAMSARAPAARRFRASDVLEGEVAAKYIATLRAQPPGAATAHALHGLDLFRSERFAEAAAALQEALMLDQRNAPAAFVLGWAYEGAGDRRQAIGAWRAAAVADPTLLPAHLALADAYMRISEPALAAQALRAWLSVLPESPEAIELKNKLRQIEGK